MDELTEYLTASDEDGFWEQIQAEARREADREPMLVSFSVRLRCWPTKRLEDGSGLTILANKLHTPELPAILLPRFDRRGTGRRRLDLGLFVADLMGGADVCIWARGAMCSRFLYYKGFHACCSPIRVAHWLWQRERKWAWPRTLQNRISEAFGVDVHPAARIGSGVLIDHGTSVVIGETAVVEDNVSMLH